MHLTERLLLPHSHLRFDHFANSRCLLALCDAIFTFHTLKSFSQSGYTKKPPSSSNKSRFLSYKPYLLSPVQTAKMSTPTKPNDSKGKKQADESSNSGNDSVSGDSNSSGSTTPRATPRAGVTIALSGSPSSYSYNPFPGGLPRPMPPIDHSTNLRRLASRSLLSERTSSTSAAPVTLDSVFGRIKEDMGKLSDKEKVINAQENTLSFREQTVRNHQKKADDTAEKAQERERVANAKWNAAVEVEKDNKEEKERLESIERELTLREAELQRRETELQRREAIIRHHTGSALDAELAAVGRTAPTQQSNDPTSNEGDLSSSQTIIQQHASTLFASAVAEPQRGRTLHSPHIREEQPFSTTSNVDDDSADLPFRSGDFSSLRPRRVSSANLSIATPTPLRVRRGSHRRRIAAYENLPGDVYDSSGEEEEAGESIAGEEQEQEEVEESPAPAERPRERSVRRVSRNENLRR